MALKPIFVVTGIYQAEDTYSDIQFPDLYYDDFWLLTVCNTSRRFTTNASGFFWSKGCLGASEGRGHST